MKTAAEKRLDDCYGDLRCWNWVQKRCPVYEECKAIAGMPKNARCQRNLKDFHEGKYKLVLENTSNKPEGQQ